MQPRSTRIPRRAPLHLIPALLAAVLASPAGAQTPAPEPAADDPLAALAQLGDSLTMAGPEAGGSIRAKKDADLSDTARRKDKRNLEAKVVEVKRAAFPWIALKLKVVTPPKEGAHASAVDKNADIVVIPELKLTDKRPDLNDPATVLNAGAFYLRPGDKVVLRLKEQQGQKWLADYIERG